MFKFCSIHSAEIIIFAHCYMCMVLGVTIIIFINEYHGHRNS